MPHRHRLERTKMLRADDGEARFVAVCWCGWESAAVRAERVGIVHEEHVDEIRRQVAREGDGS